MAPSRHGVPHLDVGEAALPVPVDHDRRGGRQGGVHAPGIADVEGAELLARLDVQRSLVNLELRVRMSLKGTRKLFKLLWEEQLCPPYESLCHIKLSLPSLAQVVMVMLQCQRMNV